jgi:hypothetical protein
MARLPELRATGEIPSTANSRTLIRGCRASVTAFTGATITEW